jgi:ATP-binding cassette subfamily B (MDR/TAP) protein 1
MTLVLLGCLPFLAAVGAMLGKLTGSMEKRSSSAYASAGELAKQCLEQVR